MKHLSRSLDEVFQVLVPRLLLLREDCGDVGDTPERDVQNSGKKIKSIENEIEIKQNRKSDFFFSLSEKVSCFHSWRLKTAALSIAH